MNTLHVSTSWKAINEKERMDNRAVNEDEDKSLLVKINNKKNKGKQKDEMGIKNVRAPQVNQDDLSKYNQVILLAEKDMSMMKRCQKKMSLTISSFYLNATSNERHGWNFLIKVSFLIIRCVSQAC